METKFKHIDSKTGEIFIGEKAGGPVYNFTTKKFNTQICLKRCTNGKNEFKWVELSECIRIR